MSELKETLLNIAEEKRNKIIPENIKSGVQIFDVVGVYEGEGGSDPELEASFLSLIDSSLGENVTKFPSNLTVIGTSAFYNKTNLKITKLPEGVVQIGTAAFEKCSGLTVLELPTTLVTIGQSAFYNCSKLTEVTCLGDVSVIDRNAFNSSGLKKLIMPNITKLVSLAHSNALSSTNIATGGIYVPDALVATFKGASSSNWSYYVDNIKPISEL